MAKDQNKKGPSTSSQVAGSAAKTATKKVATKVATKATVQAAGQALGSLAPGVGNAIAAVASEIVGELIARMVNAMQKASKDVRDLLGGIALASAHLFSLFLSVLSAAGVALISPIVIVFIVIPFTVAIVLFIINAGAWVVPPWTGDNTNPYIDIESAFIDVVKTPSPTSSANAPATFHYTITISAERGVLSNLSYDYICLASLEDSRIQCPPATDSGQTVEEIAELTCGPTISANQPCVVEYDFTYGSNYMDSIVVDTLVVTANTEGLVGEQASGTASVTIGTPPTGCITPVGNNWPAQQLANLNSAIVIIVSQHPIYAAKVCAAGEIPICWGPTLGSWGYHNHDEDCDITMDSAGEGLDNVRNATYILAHELAHHLDAISGYYQDYIDYPGTAEERPICSYSATWLAGEAFAEGIALNITLPTFWDIECTGTYQGLYPSHYRFVNEFIF